MQLEVEVSSRYSLEDGIHASQSNFLAALDPKSPVATSITLKGNSSLVKTSFSISNNC